MPHELHTLAFTIILGLAHLMIATSFITKQRGLKWNLSPRDETATPLTGITARLDRSYKNFMETFVFFAAAVLLVHALQKHTEMAAVGALIYFAARVIYIPLYAFGIIGLRTLVWLVSLVGIAAVLASLVV